MLRKVLYIGFNTLIIIEMMFDFAKMSLNLMSKTCKSNTKLIKKATYGNKTIK